MFNRAFQVKVVKTKKSDATQEQAVNPDDFQDRAKVIGYYMERIVEKAAHAALMYVVVDTARQVLIARTTKS